MFTLTDRADVDTLRGAVEWYKAVYRGTEPLGDLTKLEQNYVNGEWAQLVRELAEVQGIPAGMLSYWLNELAVLELQLAKVAGEEAQAAQSYDVAPHPYDGQGGVEPQ